MGVRRDGVIEVVEWEYPDGWFQHLKQYLGFSKIRMKKEKREVRWNQVALFPDINPSYTDQHRILTYIEK